MSTLRLFPDSSPTEISAAACPSDPLKVLAVLQYVLPWALVYRRGTYHIQSCQDSRVNSTVYGCSDKCVAVQSVFLWINTTLESCPSAEERRARRLG